jgi:hypothetical protein
MSEEKTHWKKQFNYDYLGSYSLLPGQDMILTIRDMKKEMVVGGDGKKQECFVAYFKEDQKPMILNRTNCKTIGKIYQSPYIEDWVGKKIQVFVSAVRAFGEDTEALRVRNYIPADTSKLIEDIKACKTTEDIAKLYEANKSLWSGTVKAAGLERNAQIKAAK